MAFLKRFTPYAVAVLLLAVFYVRVPPPLGKTSYEHLQTISLYSADLPSVQATPYEYLLFVVQWPFAVCSEKKNCTYNVLPNNFTIHGLWPANCSGNHLECTGTNFSRSEMDEQQPLQNSLRVSWPDLVNNDNMTFWEDEYNKHGRCCDNNFSQTKYFQKADQLWRQHRVEVMFKNEGYDPGNSYSLAELQGAIRKTTTKDPALRCKDVQKKLADKQLFEVFICFDYNGENVINCSSNLSNCLENETILWKKGPN